MCVRARAQGQNNFMWIALEVQDSENLNKGGKNEEQSYGGVSQRPVCAHTRTRTLAVHAGKRHHSLRLPWT